MAIGQQPPWLSWYKGVAPPLAKSKEALQYEIGNNIPSGYKMLSFGSGMFLLKF